MYRKFNLWFSLIDKERFDAVSANEEAGNPFMEDGLVICSSDFAASSVKISSAITEAEWDLVIVDEAHHLAWTESEASIEYKIVEEISRSCERLILLTATPDQLGEESHFARLRLLDHERFQNLEVFKKEQSDYRNKVKGIDRLLEVESLDKKKISSL